MTERDDRGVALSVAGQRRRAEILDQAAGALDGRVRARRLRRGAASLGCVAAVVAAVLSLRPRPTHDGSPPGPEMVRAPDGVGSHPQAVAPDRVAVRGNDARVDRAPAAGPERTDDPKEVPDGVVTVIAKTNPKDESLHSLDDDELLQQLAELGVRAGLIEVNGQRRLVTPDGRPIDLARLERPSGRGAGGEAVPPFGGGGARARPAQGAGQGA